MADKKTNETNYVIENAVFLYDTINLDNCAKLMGDIASMVAKIRPNTNKTNSATNISPYDIHKPSQAIDVFINSPGGTCSLMDSIMTFLNIARSKGAIIRTTVTGRAASCASQIAIQGTPGFRIMYQTAFHLVHYGNSSMNVSAEGEVERACKNEKQLRQHQINTYKKFTNLTAKEINECMKTEHHVFSAEECLKKNMCDWILTDTGIFISRENQR